MKSLSDNIKSEKQWLRALFMLLFCLIYEIAKILIFFTAVLQFLFAIIGGKANDQLQRFGSSMAQYAHQIVRYLTYVDDKRPFPFSDWPEPEGVDSEEIESEVIDNQTPEVDEVAAELTDQEVEAAEEESGHEEPPSNGNEKNKDEGPDA